MTERAPEEQRQVDEAIIKRNFKTEEEMVEALGGLTPEQEAKLNDPAMYAPSTQEELARLGPDFSKRTLELAKERQANSEQ